MSENIETQVTVVDWEVKEYHDNFCSIAGYNEEGEEVVHRWYELDPWGTRVKNDDGEWVNMNDMDDGGFPNEAVFTAYKEE
jgi:broad-specificity NMP kinase